MISERGFGRAGRRPVRTAAGALAALLLVSGCGVVYGVDGAGSSANTVTIAVTASFPDLDPHRSTSNVNYLVNHENVYEGLVRLDGTGNEVLPALATEWELVDPSTWRFELREGVAFHDGEPFDAQAAVASIERVIGDERSADLASYFTRVEGARATGPHTIEIVTDGHVPDLLLNLTNLMMVPPEKARQDGGDALTDEPTGTGPYRFVRKSTDSIVLEPFRDHWGGPPPDRRIEVISRPEASSEIAGLRAGEIDIAYDIPRELVGQLPKEVSAPVLEHVVLRLNGLGGPTADPRVRRAINMAVDRRTLREALVGEKYSVDPKCQFAPPGVVGHDPELDDTTPYDVAGARALVREAGAVGEKIRLVSVQGRYPKSREIVEAAAHQIERTGLEVELRILNNQNWLAEIYATGSGRPDAALIGVNVDQWNVLQPFDSIVSDSSSLSTFPHGQSPRVSALIDEARSLTDRERRLDLQQRTSRAVCESNAFVWLYGYHQIWGAQESVSWDVRRDNKIVFSGIRIAP
ncbi:ABC transporter substrate-binding protein [Actinomadura cremea]|nr:ABC transporter substrate-binding protein [Actinomadura cremea]